MISQAIQQRLASRRLPYQSTKQFDTYLQCFLMGKSVSPFATFFLPFSSDSPRNRFTATPTNAGIAFLFKDLYFCDSLQATGQPMIEEMENMWFYNVYFASIRSNIKQILDNFRVITRSAQLLSTRVRYFLMKMMMHRWAILIIIMKKNEYIKLWFIL